MNNFERASKIVDFCNLLKLLDYKICCHLNSNKINYIFPSTKKRPKDLATQSFIVNKNYKILQKNPENIIERVLPVCFTFVTKSACWTYVSPVLNKNSWAKINWIHGIWKCNEVIEELVQNLNYYSIVHRAEQPQQTI